MVYFLSMMHRLRQIFSIDLRTLALFRACIALVILADLGLRLRDFTAFHAAGGLLPRSAHLAGGEALLWSFHFISDTPLFQGVLFAIAALGAWALLIGYRTRAASIVSFLMLVSLQNRNPMVLQGGDVLLSCLAFWAMFLPLGARWSIDDALNVHSETERPQQHFSAATIGALMQTASVYFFTALLKNGTEWANGTAVYYSLRGTPATGIGEWLSHFPTLCTWLTHYVWHLEILSPLLFFPLFWYARLRFLGLVLLVAMHAAFELCLGIGLFPFISIASLSLFLPPAFWQWWERKASWRTAQNIVIYYDGPCEFCRKTCLIFRSFCLPHTVPVLPAQSDPAIHALLEQHHSWVVTGPDGARYVRWQAVAFVLRQHPALAWKGWLWSLPVLHAAGDRLYGWIARHRPRMGTLTARLLPYREMRLMTPAWMNLVAACCAVFMLYDNIASLPQPGWPKLGRAVTRNFRVYQSWDMFAPIPNPYRRWYVVEGQNRDGLSVPVYGDPASPEIANDTYANYRWRKYWSSLSRATEGNPRRKAAARYFCARWNRAHADAGQRLQRVTITRYSEKILPDYAFASRSKTLLVDASCGDPR